jgi:hypothetical protein
MLLTVLSLISGLKSPFSRSDGPFQRPCIDWIDSISSGSGCFYSVYVSLVAEIESNE